MKLLASHPHQHHHSNLMQAGDQVWRHKKQLAHSTLWKHERYAGTGLVQQILLNIELLKQSRKNNICRRHIRVVCRRHMSRACCGGSWWKHNFNHLYLSYDKTSCSHVCVIPRRNCSRSLWLDYTETHFYKITFCLFWLYTGWDLFDSYYTAWHT